MTPAQYAVCRPIVRSLAHRYGQGRAPAQSEDLELVGWEYALLALKSWEEGVGELPAYVVRRVRHGIIDYLRQNWRSRSGVGPQYTDQRIFTDTDDLVGEGAIIAPAHSEDHSTRLDAERLLSRLPDRWEDVVRRIYFEDEKGTDIAQDLGVSSARITQIHQRALARMARCA